MRLQTICMAGLFGSLTQLAWLAMSATSCAAEPPLQMGQSDGHERGVPFFSRGGHVLAKRLGLRSPVRILALKMIDPPRNVSADRWHGLFCKEWIDAIKHCSWDGNVTCRERTRDEKAYYQPKLVECTDEVPFDQNLRVCAQLVTDDLGQMEGGRTIRIRALAGAFITYDRDLKKWCYRVAEDTLLPARRPNEDAAKLLYQHRDISCQGAWKRDDASITIETKSSDRLRPNR